MEYQKTDQPTRPVPSSAPTCLSDLKKGDVVPPELAIPETNPILEIKRQQRWEQIFDIDGSLWEVREARATKHGFDLLFGFPANSHLQRVSAFCGPNRLIATPALVAYWEANRTNEGAVYDLPAGRTTLKRVRSRLRLNFWQDRRDLWKKRSADLQTLPIREFAERYNVTKEMANAWSHKLLGRNVRPLDWWHHPAALAVLRTPGLKLREIAQKLGIGTSHANRLRKRARAADPKLLEQKVAGPIATVRFPRKPTIPPVKNENPFQNHRKQGEMFLGREFWQRPLKGLSTVPKDSARADEPAPNVEPKRRQRSTYSHSKHTAKVIGQTLLPFGDPRGPEPRPVLHQIQDVKGTFYDVYETRPSKHGFDLLFGYPVRAHRRLYTAKGKPGLIATSELVAYWEAHRTDLHANFDLPAGKTTLIRVRHRLGFNMILDQEAVWRERIPDLEALPLDEFAKKYNVTYHTAVQWRLYLLGRVRRAPGWSEDPAVIELLGSDLSHSEVGQKLGITTAHARNLRRGPSAQKANQSVPARWQTPAALEALRSSLTNAQLGEQLGISSKHAGYLRRLLSAKGDIAELCPASPHPPSSKSF
jgi:hypothetical protein